MVIWVSNVKLSLSIKLKTPIKTGAYGSGIGMNDFVIQYFWQKLQPLDMWYLTYHVWVPTKIIILCPLERNSISAVNTGVKVGPVSKLNSCSPALQGLLLIQVPWPGVISTPLLRIQFLHTGALQFNYYYYLVCFHYFSFVILEQVLSMVCIYFLKIMLDKFSALIKDVEVYIKDCPVTWGKHKCLTRKMFFKAMCFESIFKSSIFECFD